MLHLEAGLLGSDPLRVRRRSSGVNSYCLLRAVRLVFLVRAKR